MVYVALSAAPVVFCKFSETTPVPIVAPPVRPASYTALQVKVEITALLIDVCGLTVNMFPEQVVKVDAAPAGIGSTGMVTVYGLEAHPAPVGVIVKTALTAAPALDVRSSEIGPVPLAAPPVMAGSYTAVQVNGVPGLKVAFVFVQIDDSVRFGLPEDDMIGWVIVNELPAQLPAVGVMVYTTLRIPTVGFCNVSFIIPDPLPAPPVRPAS